MCGRFNMTADPLTRLFMAMAGRPFPGGDRLNVAPTESVPVVATEVDAPEPRLAEMRWWLVPHWAAQPESRYAMFNARAEGLTRSRAFRTPFARRRCVVPVSGFYEWLREGDRKLPYYLAADGDDGLRLAAIWDHWPGRDGQPGLESFALITTEAHGSLTWLHHRQPVILDDSGARVWLDPGSDQAALLSLCAPALPVPLAVAEVDRRVNNARFKDAACLEPVGPVKHLTAAAPSPP